MVGVLGVLNAATPSRERVELYMDGAAQAAWEEARDRLDDAVEADAKNRSLADLPAMTSVVDEMEAARQRMLDSRVVFEFERIAWTSRVELQAAHPPRKSNLIDMQRGFNVSTFWPALIRVSCISVTGVDGEVVADIPAETWDGLLGYDGEPGSLNFKQVEILTQAASNANDGTSTVPPSARSLLGSQDSGASLAQPSPGTSPRADSKAGSRLTSPKSSATKKARTRAGSSDT